MIGDVSRKEVKDLLSAQQRRGKENLLAVSLELGLEQHLVLGRKTDASAEDVLHGRALLGQGVDDLGADGDKGSLEHVGQDGEDRVEGSVLGHVLSLVLDTGHELGQDDQVQDQGRGQEGILAGVVHGDGVASVHENLGNVLIQSTLGVTDSGDVLDDNQVIGVLTLLVKDVVSSDHVVDNVRLGDLLGTELLGGRQVLAVVVTQMVVRGNGEGLDTGVDEEVDNDRLDLGLARLEVITSNVDLVTLSKGNASGNEGVLGGSVDEGSVLQDGSNGEDGRGRDLLVRSLDSVQQVVGGVVDALDQRGETLSVGGPDDNDLVEVVGSLEVADVSTDLLDVGMLVSAGENVVSTVRLVSGNEVGVVDGREGLEGRELLLDLTLEIVIQDLGTGHGLGQVQGRDIPTAEDHVVGVDHGQNVREGNVDIVTLLVNSELQGRSLDDGSKVVGGLDTLLGVPGKLAAVGDDGGGQGRSVVSTPADHHETIGQSTKRGRG